MCHATESENMVEYDSDIQSELGVLKGDESKCNGFDSVFRIDSNRQALLAT
jgi:hypothetical protein